MDMCGGRSGESMVLLATAANLYELSEEIDLFFRFGLVGGRFKLSARRRDRHDSVCATTR
jgi:hypothetical protein